MSSVIVDAAVPAIIIVIVVGVVVIIGIAIRCVEPEARAPTTPSAMAVPMAKAAMREVMMTEVATVMAVSRLGAS